MDLNGQKHQLSKRDEMQTYLFYHVDVLQFENILNEDIKNTRRVQQGKAPETQLKRHQHRTKILS